MNYGVQGDSIVGFRGRCDLPAENIVDGEDLRQKSVIAGSDMLHFVLEVFNKDLPFAVLAQRLMVSILRELITEKTSKTFRREGDDLYFEDGKLNISIATVSPVSALIHIGVNVSNEGTPVKTASLEEFGIGPDAFAQELMGLWQKEFDSAQLAATKVKWVR